MRAAISKYAGRCCILRAPAESRFVRMRQRILIIVHQEHSNPGRVGELLQERGYRLDRRCPNLFDPLPDDLSSYAGAIVFGGPQSANDDDRPGRADRARLARAGRAAERQAAARHLPRRADDRPGARRQGRPPSREPGRDRLPSDLPDRGRRGLFRRPDDVLPVAQGDLRDPARARSTSPTTTRSIRRCSARASTPSGSSSTPR